MPASVLRSICFSCRQEASETVAEFSLRLQELFLKLQKDTPLANIDILMRDQLVDGLQDRIMRRELRTLILSTPTLSFSDIKKEVRIRIEAEGEDSITTCYVVGRPPLHPAATLDLQQFKKDLKEEMTAELRDQMASLAKNIVSELRTEFSQGFPDTYRGPFQSQYQDRGEWQASGRGQYHFPRYQEGERRPSLPTPSPAAHPQGSARRVGPNINQFDPEGRPICRNCQRVGHIQRYCQQRERSNSTGSVPLNS